jgi:hypothetical protein
VKNIYIGSSESTGVAGVRRATEVNAAQLNIIATCRDKYKFSIHSDPAYFIFTVEVCSFFKELRRGSEVTVSISIVV